MLLKANAKINLALNVLDKKENGYHELDMIMASLDLADDVEIIESDKDEILMDGADVKLEENTVYKALTLYRKAIGSCQSYKVVIKKRIPMQAGLAGGSSDAAAVLQGLNDLNDSRLSFEELISIGEKIGADVPFCLYKKIARVKGIGEKILPISFDDKLSVLLVKPDSGVSTKAAFQNCRLDNMEHPNVDLIIEKMESRSDFLALIGNSLEQSAFELNPNISSLKEELLSYNLKAVLMSGSGSCVFAIDEKDTLKKIYDQFKNKYPFVELTEII